MTVTAPNTQVVGQSLTLTCSVSAVRGITSSVDIIWRSGSGIVLTRTNNMSPTMMDALAVYSDLYTIPELCPCSADQNEVQCEVVINTSPLVMATGGVSLNMMSECDYTFTLLHLEYMHFIYTAELEITKFTFCYIPKI